MESNGRRLGPAKKEKHLLMGRERTRRKKFGEQQEKHPHQQIKETHSEEVVARQKEPPLTIKEHTPGKHCWEQEEKLPGQQAKVTVKNAASDAGGASPD